MAVLPRLALRMTSAGEEFPIMPSMQDTATSRVSLASLPEAKCNVEHAAGTQVLFGVQADFLLNQHFL